MEFKAYLVILVVGMVTLLAHNAESGGHSASPLGTQTIVVGDKSGPNNDDHSLATCPMGTTLVNCYCSIADKCDGVETTGRKCFAFNRWLNTAGIQAVAVCSTDDASKYRQVFSGLEPNPVATCPCDFRVIACFIHNMWVENGYRAPAIKAAGKSCESLIKCDEGAGCLTRAICRRI